MRKCFNNNTNQTWQSPYAIVFSNLQMIVVNCKWNKLNHCRKITMSVFIFCKTEQDAIEKELDEFKNRLKKYLVRWSFKLCCNTVIISILMLGIIKGYFTSHWYRSKNSQFQCAIQHSITWQCVAKCSNTLSCDRMLNCILDLGVLGHISL